MGSVPGAAFSRSERPLALRRCAAMLLPVVLRRGWRLRGVMMWLAHRPVEGSDRLDPGMCEEK